MKKTEKVLLGTQVRTHIKNPHKCNYEKKSIKTADRKKLIHRFSIKLMPIKCKSRPKKPQQKAQQKPPKHLFMTAFFWIFFPAADLSHQRIP